MTRNISIKYFQWSLSNHIEPYLVNDTSNHPLADMQIFLSDPWKFLEQPLAVYQEAELLKGHEFDKKKARTDMTPFISSLLNTRNPQVISGRYYIDHIIRTMLYGPYNV